MIPDCTLPDVTIRHHGRSAVSDASCLTLRHAGTGLEQCPTRDRSRMARELVSQARTRCRLSGPSPTNNRRTLAKHPHRHVSTSTALDQRVIRVMIG
jgi:hypothetical protein